MERSGCPGHGESRPFPGVAGCGCPWSRLQIGVDHSQARSSRVLPMGAPQRDCLAFGGGSDNSMSCREGHCHEVGGWGPDSRPLWGVQASHLGSRGKCRVGKKKGAAWNTRGCVRPRSVGSTLCWRPFSAPPPPFRPGPILV